MYKENTYVVNALFKGLNNELAIFQYDLYGFQKVIFLINLTWVHYHSIDTGGNIFLKNYVTYTKKEEHRVWSSQKSNYDNENISKNVKLNPRIETINNI